MLSKFELWCTELSKESQNVWNLVGLSLKCFSSSFGSLALSTEFEDGDCGTTFEIDESIFSRVSVWYLSHSCIRFLCLLLYNTNSLDSSISFSISCSSCKESKICLSISWRVLNFAETEYRKLNLHFSFHLEYRMAQAVSLTRIKIYQ